MTVNQEIQVRDLFPELTNTDTKEVIVDTKKKSQLGMNPSTASHRLVKDILFSFVTQSDTKCFHCGEEMTRETFSIEHKIPWLDSENPSKLFFDLDNIGFSHFSCNVSKARKIKSEVPIRERWAQQKRNQYTTEKRRAKYRKHGY